MLREIVRTQKNELTIKIPNEYLDKELEVFILPLEPEKKSLIFRNNLVMHRGNVGDHPLEICLWSGSFRNQKKRGPASSWRTLCQFCHRERGRYGCGIG